MWLVFGCESGHRQLKEDGSPLASPTNDFGFAQVNRKVWHTTAIEMGLDYQNSLEDNLKMAKHIYEVQGISAWVCAHKLGIV